MRLAFFGDVIGKSGRDGISDHLPGLKRDLKLPPLELSEEQRKALPVPPRPEARASEPIGALRSYPPLEGAR